METWETVKNSSVGEEFAFQFEVLIKIANDYHDVVRKMSANDEETLNDLDNQFCHQTMEAFGEVLLKQGNLKSFIMFVNTEGVNVYVTDRDPGMPTNYTTMHLDKCKDLFFNYKPFMVFDMFCLDFLVQDINRSLLRFVMTDLVIRKTESHLIEFELGSDKAVIVRQTPVPVEKSEDLLGEEFALS